MGGWCRAARIVLGCGTLLAWVPLASASLRTVSDDVLARLSAGAVEGQVVASTAQWDADAGAIYTLVTIAVDRSWGLDGPPPVVVLKQLGGVVGATALVVGGQASFEIGETVLVFLDVRPRDLTLSVAGLEQGKWTSSPGATRTRAARWSRGGDGVARGAPESRLTVDLEALAALTGTRVRATGARLTADAASAPVAPTAAVSVPGSSTSPPGRWHEADDGTPVFIDPQREGHPQFHGGGLAQLANAAALWSAAGSLRLQPGVSRGPRCFTNAEPFDGRISIAYQDPCDEIADTSPTLAIAGAYFSAIDTRLIGGVAFWKLTKGMVVTDAPAAKFASLSVGCYEELLAHELGHAIGFDHATAGRAVMLPSLSTGCWSRTVSSPLGAPDLAAMAASYPTGAGPIPMTPTGLVAAVVGSTVTIQWSDADNAGASYEMHVGSRPGSSDLAVVSVASTSITVPNVPSAVYYVRLAAHTPAGTSAPTADLAVTVAGSSRSRLPAVHLAWLPDAADTTPSAYLVRVGCRPGAIDYELPAPTPSLTVPAVGAGVYLVRIVSLRQSGLGPLTPEMTVVVP